MSLHAKLASQSAIIFIARLCGAGLVFVAQAAIARLWGTGILGEYLIVIATANLAAVVMPLGFQTIGTYFAAEYGARDDGRTLRRFILRAYLHIALVALLMAVLGRPLTGFLGETGEVLSHLWLPSVLLATSSGMVFLNGALLVGLKRPFAGFFAETLLRPMLVIGSFTFVAAFVSGGEQLATMLWMLSTGFLAVALIQFGIVIVTVRRVPTERPAKPAEWKRWWRFAAPWAIISLASDFFFDLDLILLAGLMGRHDLAIFGVCARIFALVSFGVAAVYAVTIPHIFEAEANSDRAGFHAKIGDANLVATGISIVLLIATAVGGPFALLLFGDDFLAGTVPLTILCVALVVRSAFGPASVVLSIHDRPYASLPAIGLGVATLIAGNYALVPAYGVLGASIAALGGITIWSAGLWFTALKLAKVDVSVLARFRAARPSPASRGPAASV